MSALRRLGLKGGLKRRGWTRLAVERPAKFGLSFYEKGTSSGVERHLRVWRFARWDYEFVWWRAG